MTPWGCLLLDPRDHVAQYLAPTPSKELIYFVSSMCHPSTWDLLVDAGVKIIGYHASVGAGESDVVRKEFARCCMIHGGTTSGIRGIHLFYALGFRKFETYGFDSSYHKKPEKAHGRIEKPVIELEVGGRKFISDPELVAQSQDIEMLLKMFPDCQFVFHGDGLLQHASTIAREHFEKSPGIQDTVEARTGPWVHSFKGKGLSWEATSIDNAIKALTDRRAQIQDHVVR